MRVAAALVMRGARGLGRRAKERCRCHGPGILARLVSLHQHGNVVWPRARIQLVPPFPLWRRILGVCGLPAVLADPRQFVTAGEQRLRPRPLVGRARLEKAAASRQGVAVQQVSVLDGACADQDLDVAAVGEDGEFILRQIRAGGADR